MNNAINYQQQIDQLTNQQKPLKRSFGHGLNLKVYKTGKAVWICRYTFNKKRKEILIGDTFITDSDRSHLPSCGRLTYEDALIKALEMNRDLKANNLDPQIIAFKQASSLATLTEVADNYFKKHGNRFKHPEIPQNLYKKYVENSIGNFQIQDITPAMVLDLLEKVNDDGKPTISNDLLQLFKSKIFHRAVVLGLIRYSP